MAAWADGGILLTGATGLVGGELLPRLLSAAPTATVHCLVRARSAGELERRGLALLVSAGISPRDGERVRVVRGDVTAPGLGLERHVRAQLAHSVRSVVHAAASTRFDLELEDARRINVAGTEHALAFAREAGAHLHYVSTAYVVGDRGGVLGVRDGDAPGAFHNSYEASKWQAEQLARAASHSLPVTVYRPSIIVGDARTGRTPHFRVLYEPFKWVIYGKTSVLPCRPDVRLDVVPVDYVADAIVCLGAQAEASGSVYQLSAGPDRSLSIAQLLALSEPIVNGWLRARQQPAVAVPRIVSPDDAAPELAKLFSLGAAVMRTHVPYMLREVLFDDRETRAALAPHGLTCPPLASYLDRLLAFALERGFGTA
jgi:thioester reductase-like protein